MTIRNRVRELRMVKASELIPNSRNWRRHPKQQADALRGILSEIGYADALLARETPDGLMLVDGHLRRDTTPDQIVPVLVLDLTEDEANTLLAALDPLAGMATADPEKLDALLRQVSVTDAALREMLAGVAESAGLSVKSPAAGDAETETLPENYDIIVACASDAEQRELLERLAEEGYQCRALMS